MYSIKNIFFNSIIFFVLALILLNGCSEDNIIPPEEHFEPAGLFILNDTNNTDTILQVFQGNVRTGDTLLAPFNAFSQNMLVNFWDQNRNFLSHPSGNEYTLGINISSSVAEADIQGWSFRLKGLSLLPDTASLQIKVLHHGHSDFITPFIPVKVIP